MDTLNVRRKAVTYGKAGKRLPLQNLFDQTSATDLPDTVQEVCFGSQTDTPSKKIGGSGSDKSERDYNSEESEIEAAAQLRHNLEVSLQYDDSSTSESSNRQRDSTNSSIFEVLSSDDETGPRAIPPRSSKRRKLTPVRKPQPQSAMTGTNQEAHMAGIKSLNPATKNEQSRHAKLGDNQLLRNRKLVGVQARPRGRQPKPAIQHKHSLIEEIPSIQDAGRDEQQPTAVTPKNRKFMTADLVASPSQLRLGSLHLASHEGSESGETPCDDLDMESNIVPARLAPSKSRQRLVEELDSPHRSPRKDVQPQDLEEPHSEKAIRVSSLHSQMPVDEYNPPGDTDSIITNPEKNEVWSATDFPSTRQKPTYGQQRSHLSDMDLSNIDIIVDTSNASFRGLVASQESTHTSFGSRPEVDMQEEEDEDEDAPLAPIKSIHELRQAGVNTRFERDLEALFEDLESNSTSARGLRIQASIQLIHKFEEQNFVRQFLDLGIEERLASQFNENMDVLYAALLSFAMLELLLIGQPGPRALRRIFEATGPILPIILSERRTLTKIVKDRRLNLSRVLARDIVDFQNTVTEKRTWAPIPSLPVTPVAIGIRLLELLLRHLRDVKEFRLQVPNKLVKSCFALAEECLRPDSSVETPAYFIEGTFSLIEYFILSESLRHDQENNQLEVYKRLASILAYVLSEPISQFSDLRHLALRLVVAITNDRPIACDCLASTTIPQVLMRVVEDNFSSLAAAADPDYDDDDDDDDTFDTTKLEALIFALDSLLDLANASDTARAALSSEQADGSSIVKRTISIFNTRSGKAAEASTNEQSLLSVPFGHLCMLLCTMCLDTDIRDNIVSLLPDHSIAALCIEAGTFLDQLQTTVVHMQDEQNPACSATKALSERFQVILTSLIQNQ